jgi:hypothetical protein
MSLAPECNATQTLYQTDFYAWTQEQAAMLRSGQWQQLDVENLIEEIEALGRRERQELRNRLGVLLGHLLKWQFQPQQRSRSWLITMREQRRELDLLLRENPSLKPYLSEALELAYAAGLDLAERETNMAFDTFPAACPYTFEQAMDTAFLPK